MNSRKMLLFLVAFAMVAFTSSAQTTKLLLKFRATCRTTTDSGKMVTKVITEREIIQLCASTAGLGTTNLNRFLLIYDVGSDMNGDTIKVVRRTDGGTICQPFRVLFQESITDGSSRRDERFGLLFNFVDTDTKGSVIIVEKPFMRQDGSLGPNYITGKFQMLDEVFFPERKGICSGFFTTGREVSWE